MFADGHYALSSETFALGYKT